MSDHSSPSAFVIIAGPGAGKTIELPNKEIVIGRISPADIVISHIS
jgi:hypothetical protein